MEYELPYGFSAELTARKPVLAILTMSDPKLGFRGNRANFADLVRTGKEMGFIVYVLPMRYLKFSQPMLTGFSLADSAGKGGSGKRDCSLSPTSSTTASRSARMSSCRASSAS